jgi:hypothetical protein
MPTPSQISAAKRAAAEDPYFTVHEVVDCVSEGEEGFGEEDLPEEQRSGGAKEQAARQHCPRGGDNKAGMQKRITQETFEAAVRENMDEFDMDFDAAIKAAKEEFLMQGVSLSSIDTDAKSLGQ